MRLFHNLALGFSGRALKKEKLQVLILENFKILKFREPPWPAEGPEDTYSQPGKGPEILLFLKFFIF